MLLVGQVVVGFVTQQESMVLLKDSQDQMAKEVVKESDDLDGDEILNNHQHPLVHGTDIDQEGNLQEDY